MASFTVHLQGEPLDLQLCVMSGQVFRWEQSVHGSWFGVEGRHWYRIHEGENHLSVESNAGRQDFEQLFALDLKQDNVDQEIIRRGSELEPYIKGLRGLRLMRPTDASETLFSFLCTANNHLSRIMPMVRKLAQRGEVIDELDGKPIHRFPDANTIAQIKEEELRSEGFGYRARSIPEVGRQIAAKPDNWLLGLHSDGSVESYRNAHQELCAIPSIGPKLADCICLIGLRHPYAAPFDTHLWQAVTRHYFPEWKNRAVTQARYREAGDFLRSRFGELTGIAHQYLFYDNLLNWRSRRA